MTEQQEILWNNIKNFELDDISADFTFSDRLARENGWSIHYTIRAIIEYKKFIFLLCISSHPLTPSDQVDQVWHLHLLYTRSYWEDMCRDLLGRQIHHGPTKGGNAESDKFTDWYNKTKELYTNAFNYSPPLDIWPADKIRFKEINFLRVNTERNWIFKKPNIFRR